ncbi:MAG TPA: HAD-IIIA family hydrolase, partial [candidate division Zixibacteria bacterium]|nr:HAD-IIIA family hydrolase [candidate division Zixibacteria bacterium]
VVDLQGNFRSFLVRTLVSAGQKVVYAKERISRQRVVRLKDFSAAHHTIDKYNECLNQLGIIPAAKRPMLLSNRDSKKSQSQIQIVIAPEASFPNKEWPIERFISSAVELHQKFDAKIIWAATSKQKTGPHLPEKIESDYLTHLIDCPIDRLADIIRNSNLCLANDSGIAHLASAVGTPVIAVFGPTHPALGFSPRGLLDKVIEVDEYCRPCSLHGDKPCFREQRFCFTRITAETVVAEASQIIEKGKTQSKALFADRDGTVIIDKPFDSNPDNIDFESGSIEALKHAQKLGLKIIVVSNQSGVARGYFKEEDAVHFNRVLVEQLKQKGIEITAIYFCPHYAKGTVANYAKVCNCRKPAAGMAEKAALEHNIDLRNSYVVGDKLDDFNLGRIIGAQSFLVKTGQGNDYAAILEGQIPKSDRLICNNLLDAVYKIESLEKK